MRFPRLRIVVVIQSFLIPSMVVDVYAYTGAKLASGHISFEEVGPELPVDKILELPVVETIIEDNLVRGAIDILDVRLALFGPLSHVMIFTL